MTERDNKDATREARRILHAMVTVEDAPFLTWPDLICAAILVGVIAAFVFGSL